jgi:cob(I)alamin adenosyltransferase
MTKYFTGNGDNGETNLGNKKLSKDSLYAEAIGSLDELVSWLGFVRSEIKDDFIEESILKIQKYLFICQAEIGFLGAETKPEKTLSEDKIKILEDIILKIDNETSDLKNFIIPGSNNESAKLHVARSISRRAERKIVAFSKIANVSPNLLKFINRLSSTLFALARYIDNKNKIFEESPDYE